MKIALELIYFLGSLSITVQSFSKQFIGAAGKTENYEELKLSWTAGEPIVGLM
jgi:hypothetical protein